VSPLWQGVITVTDNRPRYLVLRERAREMRRAPTPAEAELWKRLRDGRLGGWHFERQFIVGEFIVDFYCHALGLVVEVDGEVHAAQRERDAERDAILASQGLRVLRFSNERVLGDTYAVLREIRRAAEDSPRRRTDGDVRPGADPPLKGRVRRRRRGEGSGRSVGICECEGERGGDCGRPGLR